MSDVVMTAAGPVPEHSQHQARVIYIICALDVMEALVNDTVDDSLYMFDNNKAGGSTGIGSNELKTVVCPGDTIVWMASGLEVETLVDVHIVSGPAAETLGVHQAESYGTKYWTCTVGEGISGTYCYSLDIQVESRLMRLSTGPTITVKEDCQ